MLYHKFMVYRVRSTTRVRGLRFRKRRHPLLSLTTLSSLGLCATAIYASIGVWDYSSRDDQNQAGIIWEFSSEIPPDSDPAFHKTDELHGISDTAGNLTDWPVIDQHRTPWTSDFTSLSNSMVNSDPDLVEEILLEEIISGPEKTAETVAPAPVSQVAPALVSQQELPDATAAKDTIQATTEHAEKQLTEVQQAAPQEAQQVAPQKVAAAQKPAPKTTNISSLAKSSKWLKTTIKNGDSLSAIFSRLGLSGKLLHKIIVSSKEAKKLEKINPGEALRVRLDEKGKFDKLILERSALSSLQVIAVKDGFETSLASKPVEVHRTQLTGVISDSLFNSAKRVGMSENMIMELTEIFGWDVDFALDIQPGDSFAVVFDEQFVDGEKYQNGDILAAEFVNHGKIFRAVRFENPNGKVEYFTPEGKSMRKTFLRAPVDFRRISSKFSPERNHPVLGKKRPHKGVDYAAATGTPIKAAGSGRISFRGTKGGYGNTVVIQHDEHHSTLYAHMSKYSSKKQGARVQQGDVIGYVGSTGLATGPHLHYEFRVDNVHIDPLKAKLTQTAKLDKKYRKDFLASSAPLVTQLNKISGVRLAKAD